MGPDYMSCRAIGEQFPTIGRTGPMSGNMSAGLPYRVAAARL
jgi:hypothetical protein